MALTTAQEVTDNSPAGKDFPKRFFDIESVEETLVNTCLGKVFYAALLANLTNVSSAVIWDCNAVYGAGNLVKKDDYYYTSTSANNTTVPGKIGASWTVAPKFTTACYNTFWGYFVKVIANKVYSEALPYSIVNSGTGGLTINGADKNQERSLTPSEVVILQKPINQKVSTILENMKIWMNADAQKACNFPANPFTEICETGCTIVPQRTRFIFR